MTVVFYVQQHLFILWMIEFSFNFHLSSPLSALWGNLLSVVSLLTIVALGRVLCEIFHQHSLVFSSSAVNKTIKERTLVFQQHLRGVKLLHSPPIHHQNTVTVHDSVKPRRKNIVYTIMYYRVTWKAGGGGYIGFKVVSTLSSSSSSSPPPPPPPPSSSSSSSLPSSSSSSSSSPSSSLSFF